MTTIDLSRSHLSAEELVKLAARGPVEIVAADGRTFVLEEVGDLGKKAKPPAKSKRPRLLNERSDEPATISIEAYRRSLD
jgi:hypothetical protein